jgi:hypothetical protein
VKVTILEIILFVQQMNSSDDDSLTLLTPKQPIHESISQESDEIPEEEEVNEG